MDSQRFDSLTRLFIHPSRRAVATTMLAVLGSEFVLPADAGAKRKRRSQAAGDGTRNGRIQSSRKRKKRKKGKKGKGKGDTGSGQPTPTPTTTPKPPVLCGSAACQPGETCCAGECQNLQSDPAHCGECGRACGYATETPANGVAACANGLCSVVCDEGFASCDGTYYTGCEVDLRSNYDHCGACGNNCEYPNAGSICEHGTCRIGACADRRIGDFVWANCDGDPGTVCETDIMNDSAHCGGCHQACTGGDVCFSGHCERPCEDGGPCRVFVTAAVSTGNLGGLEGADARCQSRAEVAHLPGTYMAWLSDDTASPSTRFRLKSTGPYWTPDRVSIANNWEDLTDGTLRATILVTETGRNPGGYYRVWTHTHPDGTAGGVGGVNCQNWTSAGAGGGDAGWCGLDTSEWTENNSPDCFLLQRLYCFQQSG